MFKNVFKKTLIEFFENASIYSPDFATLFFPWPDSTYTCVISYMLYRYVRYTYMHNVRYNAHFIRIISISLGHRVSYCSLYK